MINYCIVVSYDITLALGLKLSKYDVMLCVYMDVGMSHAL